MRKQFKILIILLGIIGLGIGGYLGYKVLYLTTKEIEKREQKSKSLKLYGLDAKELVQQEYGESLKRLGVELLEVERIERVRGKRERQLKEASFGVEEIYQVFIKVKDYPDGKERVYIDYFLIAKYGDGEIRKYKIK